VTIVQVFKTTFRVVHMVYSSRLYPRAEPRGFSLQWIKKPRNLGSVDTSSMFAT
jgi:hypothetical protein